jgi:glutamate N-acetyltransferase / amino-acid N-acetyltransferase
MKKAEFRRVDGGITAPKGFRAAALRAGIKESRTRDDLALVVSDVPGAVAGTFTTNRVKAACVKLCERHLIWGQAQAVIINSGNANACTGEQGIADAERTVELTAQHLGIAKNLVFVSSTGTIGIPLPMNKIEAALPDLVKGLSPAGGAAAAQAILTTDTAAKEVALAFPIGDKTITIGGMAKGSGMIAPNMATMLAFLTTDALVDARALQTCLAQAVEYSFNRIVVDGDESTNDTVLCIANGIAGNELIDKKHPAWHTFRHAVEYVAKALGQMIVRDGEGATRFVTVTVASAATRNDARLAARAVARSPLVKTAWNGGDPNWGRIMAAIGYSGARFQEALVDITFNEVPAVQGGKAAANIALDDLRRVYAQKEFAVKIDLHTGKSEYTVYTCDLSKDYVGINAEYMT